MTTLSSHSRDTVTDATPTLSRRRLLLTVHLSAAVSLIGSDLALLALGIAGVRGADPQTVYPAASLLATWLVGPLVLIALGTGITLAIRSGWGLARYWWVAIKLATTVLFTGIVWLLLVPRLAAAAGAATAAETFTNAERLPLSIVPAVAIAVLIVLVSLAVYKPRWRLRAGS